MIEPFLPIDDCGGKYRFDEGAAYRAERFFPLFLRHTSGLRAGEPFELLDWQRRIVRDLFGWRRRNGTRRFRQAYCEIPRKNGKSTFAAGLALYLLSFDGERSGQVYGAAYSRDQAGLIYAIAVEMVRNNKRLDDRLKIRESVKRIIDADSNSFYRAIASEAAAAHGFNAHACIFDELHTQRTPELYRVLETSMGARAQPLMFGISTAGHDRASICWELSQKSKAMLRGDIADDSFYPCIFAADESEDWTDPEVHERVNPSIGHGVSAEYLQEQCERAKVNPSFENVFRNLHLNQWTSGAVRWIPMHQWDDNKRPRPDELEGLPCWAALDLSSSRDLTAFVLVFLLPDGRYWVEPRAWLPAEAVSQRAEQDRLRLQTWCEHGYITELPGSTIDYRAVAEGILTDYERYKPATIAFDPWGNAEAICQMVESEGVPDGVCVEFRQTLANYAAPCKEFERLVAEGGINHDGHPVLRWCVENMLAKVDPAGNIRPDKGKSGEKIDVAVASIMGLGAAMQRQTDSTPIYKRQASAVMF